MVGKVIIMAAGKGTRMQNLTKNKPKPLIKVRGKPFLHYLIGRLKAAGYSDFGFIVGYKWEMISDFLKKEGVSFTLIRQEEQLGTGHAVSLASDFVGKSEFIVLGGDNLWSVDDLKSMNKSNDFCYVAGLEHKHPEKYGVLFTDGENIVRIVEKPKTFVGSMINVGLYKFTPEIFSALKQINRSERGEYEITDAINLLADEKKVKFMKLNDYWIDLGCKEDIPKVEAFLEKDNRCAE